jgi:predicted metal-dependent phosphoesterase TrpH
LTPPPAGSFRLDLHNHTDHSSDGALSPLRLLELAAARGLDALAVTDHGTLRGGLECAALAAADPSLPRVIPGAEINTAHGEIVGLYLSEDIPSGLSVDRTVEAIHAQGGLAYLPHPFDGIRRATIAPEQRERAACLVDIIEVRNGRMLLSSFNRRAFALAARLGKPMGAGSDAHYAGEVGRAFVQVPALPHPANLVELLRAGELSPQLSFLEESRAWLFHLRTGTGKLARALRRGRMPR